MTPHTKLAALSAPSWPPEPEIDDELRELEAVSRGLETHTLSANTRRAYVKAWRSFETFCAVHGLDALPAHPETVRWHVAWMSVQTDEHGLPRFSVATIRQRLAGIAEKHLREGLLDPTGHRGVTGLVRGLAKLRATRAVRKRPLLLDDVLRIIRAMDHDVYPAGVSAARDELAIWLGFAGALRRGEAAALSLKSMELNRLDGVHIHVGASKADQDNSQPDVVVLPFGGSPRTCAPCAVHRWVALMGACADRRSTMRLLYGYQLDTHVCGADGSTPLISSADLDSATPLLRATYRNRRSARIHAQGVTGDALHTMLLTRMSEAGMNPSAYGFHSLRSGFVTQARRNGADPSDVRRQTRHKSDRMVEIYDREWLPLQRNAVTSLGL
ncbi:MULTISPECIES: tyrosine-type recombinase/integrase [Arthrobacter]|uniref:Tyr recombinase domain-containing protein n=1 Tax=Arthrobacter terricola TaxID=2547396 RepID=A0A4R5K751_9MICC|nr:MULTISPECIES: tyrosine-type recombinase/integrase [Arthrobacter]MBT8163359.1 tyrosine-type recombinase/integrase [Arthrobacter sp. GN70]TDF90548.1 hypothetical protein E1809_22070 [Arthrobacter terricola]